MAQRKTCLDSKLHNFAINAEEAAPAISYSILLENRPWQVHYTISLACEMLYSQQLRKVSRALIYS